MKYLGTTGLAYLCKKISTALAGKLSLDGGTMNKNASITLTTGASDPVDLSTTVIEPGTITMVDENMCGTIQVPTLEVASIFPLNYTKGTTLSFEGPVEFYGDCTFRQGIIADTADSKVTYTSSDNLNPTAWADVDLLKSGETHKSIMQKVSAMFKNIRYLKKAVNSLENSNIMISFDTYESLEKSLPSNAQTLTPMVANTGGSAGTYLFDAYVMVLDPTFTGSLAMSISHGDNYDYVYDSRYISGMAPTMRITSIVNLNDSNDFTVSAGQVNNSSRSYNAKAYLKCCQLSKF